MKVTVFWYMRSCRLETAAYNLTVLDRRKVASLNLFTRQHGKLPTKKILRTKIYLFFFISIIIIIIIFFFFFFFFFFSSSSPSSFFLNAAVLFGHDLQYNLPPFPTAAVHYLPAFYPIIFKSSSY